MSFAYHRPVLMQEVIRYLQVKPGKKYIDCTVGDGGHTIEILKLGGEVLGLDLNESSLKRAEKRIEENGLGRSLILAKANFRDIDSVAVENGFDQVNGILYDLGFSSSQLGEVVGLSFSDDKPLDMRLDKSLGVTAEDLINGLSEKELELLFRNYGEEMHAKKFAKIVVEARKLKKIKTAKELSDLIAEFSPGCDKRLHPATRVFLALRVAVNDEIENLKISLPRAAHLLLPGGRMLVISFHSLEDKQVKLFDRSARPRIRPLEKKPVRPARDEVNENPRSRSAKMRVFEKV